MRDSGTGRGISATRRDLLAAAAVTVAAGTGRASAQAPAADWNEVLRLAKTEGRINLYTTAVPQQIERLMAAFGKKFPGIRVSHMRGSGELPARVEAEKNAGLDGADVFFHSDPLWFNRNSGDLVPLRTPFAQSFPEEQGWQIKGLAANVGFPPFGMLVWNTDLVKGGLKNFHDLLRPELQGHIGVRDDMTAVLAGYLDFLERLLGEDYLRALGRQKPKFYPTLVPAVQAVASGEIWAANIGTPFSVRDLKEQGAPIEWTTPDPKGFANSWVAGVLKASKRPNAALVFVDFTLSPEGQTALNGEDSSGSAILGLPGTLDLARYDVIKPENFPPEVRDRWRKKYEEYFRRG